MLRWRVVVGLAAGLSLGCATLYNPATGRQEVILIDTPSEVRIGRQAAQEAARQLSFSRDARQIARVKQMGQRLAVVSDRQDLQFQFYLIEGEEVNAFALPGGFVYLYTGLLDRVQSDDELANVIGHEIGHVAARHHVKQIQAVMGYQLVASLVFRHAEAAEWQRGVAVVFDLINRGYSREDELEADRLGMRYALRAGYQPWGMVSFLQTLAQLERSESGVVFTILRTHPAVSERIVRARQEADQLRQAGGAAWPEQPVPVR